MNLFTYVSQSLSMNEADQANVQYRSIRGETYNGFDPISRYTQTI